MSRAYRHNGIYAAYRGDEYLTDGTVGEIAKTLHMKKRNVQWLLSPSAKARYKKYRDNAGSRALILVEVDCE